MLETTTQQLSNEQARILERQEFGNALKEIERLDADHFGMVDLEGEEKRQAIVAKNKAKAAEILKNQLQTSGMSFAEYVLEQRGFTGILPSLTSMTLSNDNFTQLKADSEMMDNYLSRMAKLLLENKADGLAQPKSASRKEMPLIDISKKYQTDQKTTIRANTANLFLSTALHYTQHMKAQRSSLK